MGSFPASENQTVNVKDIKVEKWVSDRLRVPTRKLPSIHPNQRSSTSVFKDLAVSGHKQGRSDYSSDVEPEEVPDSSDFVSGPKSSKSKTQWGTLSESDIAFFNRDPEAIALAKEESKERRERGQAIEIDTASTSTFFPDKLVTNLKDLFDSTKIKATYTRNKNPHEDSLILEGDEVRITFPVDLLDKLTTRGRNHHPFTLTRPYDDSKMEQLQDQLSRLAFNGHRLGPGPAELHVRDNRFDLHYDVNKIQNPYLLEKTEKLLTIWEKEDLDQVKIIAEDDKLQSIMLWGKKSGMVVVPIRPLLLSLGMEQYASGPLTRISFGWGKEITSKSSVQELKETLSSIRINGVRRADILTDKVKTAVQQRYPENEISEPERRRPESRPAKPRVLQPA